MVFSRLDHSYYAVESSPFFTCSECRANFENYSSLKKHCKKTHPSQKSFQKSECPICGKSVKKLDLHMELHENSDKYFCTICQKNLKSTYESKRHEFLHSIQGKKCPRCDLIYNFTTVAAYYAHQQKHDNSFSQVVCEVCGKMFAGMQKLKLHSRVHKYADRTYACPICDKIFRSSSGFLHHKNVEHLGKKTVCEICGKELSSLQSLKVHMAFHSGDRPHTCGVCGKAFRYVKDLKHHLRIHNNDKPFECKYCDKKFRSTSHLVLHTKRIHEERDIHCEICEKSFNGQAIHLTAPVELWSIQTSLNSDTAEPKYIGCYFGKFSVFWGA